ncbi:MAG: efflux RND transporter permease subunit [Pseudanabaenaceae cyanobacterium SKYGB_i_bin29]|nr:efflux RND transporter permease subunit [Pseudanabaenaceae cyanobacterium SKYG29]MDW8421657.1 efflux RND transporter permease subunit [Pseudanabaenaceae cyanobacterium SKYGB_i_bin29]
MIFSISDLFIRRPILATVCSLIIFLLGLGAAFTLPIGQYPNITPPQVVVSSVYIGASAEVVEATVTNVLEQELNGIQGLRYITSTSTDDGVSTITLTFQPDRDQDLAAVDVQNRVATVTSRLPAPVQQAGVRVRKQTSGFLFAIGLYADKDEQGKPLYDDVFLSNYADLYLVDPIRRVNGVSNVQIFGERRFAIRTWLDPNKMAARGITTQDVIRAIQEQNLQIGVGQIGQQPAPPDLEYQLTVTAKGRLVEPEQFQEIIVRSTPTGELTRIKDIGRVELGAENYATVLRFNGVRAVGLGVSQLANANALEIADQVQSLMARLSKQFPPGIKYKFAYDTTRFIRAGAREVIVSLFLAIVLVVIILFLFLQDWRATLVPSLVIPVALVGTFIFAKLLGFNINTLTLFGLTLASGLVVDDAIVIVEDISRRINEENMNPIEAAIASMNDLVSAVIATSLVLMSVFIPVAFFPGTTGQLYRQFALTIAFSITISTFNAITFTPTLSAQLFRRGQVHTNGFFRWFNNGVDNLRIKYRSALFALSHYKGLVVILFIASLGLTYFVFTRVPTSFLPGEDQSYFITIVRAPEGVSLSYTENILKQVEQIMLAQPEVEGVFAVGGFSFAGTAPNQGIVFTTLKRWEERKRPDQAQNAIIFGRIAPQLAQIKEARVFAFPPPAILGLGNVGGFEFQLQALEGQSFTELESYAQQIVAKAKEFTIDGRPAFAPPGLRVDFSANTPKLFVEVDRDKAITLQVSPQDIYTTLQTFLGSSYVNDIDRFGRGYRVYVQADAPFRSSVDDILKLYVRSRLGVMIPLSSLVRVSQVSAPAIINHYNLFRSIPISGSAAPGISSGQAIKAMETIATQVLPRGYNYEWTGLALEEITSGGQGVLIFGFGLILVFLVLAAQYENYVDPFIIMLAVPLAILGALVAVIGRGFLSILPFIIGQPWLTLIVGPPFQMASDVYTQIGFVMLIGLASKNSILIVEFANQLRQELNLPIVKAAIEAAQLRLRPILMTALSTMIGIFPLVIASGAGAAARQSLGTAVFGGMAVATFLSLFITPVLYIVVKTAVDRSQAGLYKPDPCKEKELP